MKWSLLLAIFPLVVCGCSGTHPSSDLGQAKNVLGLPFLRTKSEGTLFSFGFEAKHYETGDGKGTIDDVAAGAEAGYVIVAIDGCEERRLAHPLITYIPYVAVLPGRHVVTLEKTLWPKDQTGPDRFSFSFNFEGDRDYRLQRLANIVFIADVQRD